MQDTGPVNLNAATDDRNSLYVRKATCGKATYLPVHSGNAPARFFLSWLQNVQRACPWVSEAHLRALTVWVRLLRGLRCTMRYGQRDDQASRSG